MKSKNKDAEALVSCKNCETQFKGNFCPNCGQSVYEYDRPFRFLVADFTGNLFAFDTRFWHSFKALVLRPGRFAKDFISGKRARYMPPFRFYIFSSFIFFILFSKYLEKQVTVSDGNKQRVTEAMQPKDSLKGYGEYLENLEIPKDLEAEIPISDEEKQEVISVIQESIDSLKIDEQSPKGLWLKINNKEASEKQYEKIRSAVVAVVNNPKIYMNSFLKFFSWSLFILMPVYAFILWVFNYRRIPHYFSHVIMAINQHNFWFILLSFLLILYFAIPKVALFVAPYLIWVLPIHALWGYRQLYQRSWLRTVFYSLMTWFLYGLILTISVAISLVIWIRAEFL